MFGFSNNERRIFISVVKSWVQVHIHAAHSSTFVAAAATWKFTLNGAVNDRSFVQFSSVKFSSFHLIVAFLCVREREEKSLRVKCAWMMSEKKQHCHVNDFDVILASYRLLLSLWILTDFVWSDIQEVYWTFIKKRYCVINLWPVRIAIKLYSLTC